MQLTTAQAEKVNDALLTGLAYLGLEAKTDEELARAIDAGLDRGQLRLILKLRAALKIIMGEPA